MKIAFTGAPQSNEGYRGVYASVALNILCYDASPSPASRHVTFEGEKKDGTIPKGHVCVPLQDLPAVIDVLQSYYDNEQRKLSETPAKTGLHHTERNVKSIKSFLGTFATSGGKYVYWHDWQDHTHTSRVWGVRKRGGKLQVELTAPEESAFPTIWRDVVPADIIERR